MKIATMLTMAHEYEIPTQATMDAIGFFAYGALAAMTRLAKDGDQAPSAQIHIDHARMSARAFELFRDLDLWASHRQLDIAELVDPYTQMLDDLEARTRPESWWERSVKTYITVGIFGDFMREISQRHQVFEDAPGPWDFGHGAWEEVHLAHEVENDPQLAARLSLWARRVAGEALGLVRATLFTYPNLAIDPDTVDAIAAHVTKCHEERMESINLKP